MDLPDALYEKFTGIVAALMHGRQTQLRFAERVNGIGNTEHSEIVLSGR